MFEFLSRWKHAGNARVELDSLLTNADPQAPLQERLEWLVELFRWMRSLGNVSIVKNELETGHLQVTRTRFLLIQLDKNPEKKKNVAKTLRSILFDTKALDLFCTTGLPTESGFFSEAIDRLTERFLPRPPHEDQLGEVFVRVFSSENDILWLEKIESTLLNEIIELFNYENSKDEGRVWDKLNSEIEDAILFLVGQIRAFGLNPKIRIRSSEMPLRDRPFFQITGVCAQLLKDTREATTLDDELLSMNDFRDVLFRCREELQVAHQHLNVYGVSVSIVHELDRIEALIGRTETLVEILTGEQNDPKKILRFICSLITELRDRESIRSFLNENLALLSMKIAEQNAEAGEHYITRNPNEYNEMFRKAAGGGIIAGLIAFTKTFMEEMSLSYFIQGIFKSINYSVGFIGIYSFGYTLATRQPAMTANALAAKMHNLNSDKERSSLVDEVVNLIRSQGASILGNVFLVIPTTLLIFTILFYAQGTPLMDKEEALKTLSHYSILGLTPLHAAFTGFLLWLSSVIAGWVHNWSVYHEIPQALASHRKLKAMLGPSRLQRWISLYQKHLSGWVGYISLGFLLGMSPKILGFFGIPLDVRHVTISSGTITLASASLGLDFIYHSQFWLAIIGIFFIGIMNVSVSFFLAFWVALKSRRIKSSIRDEIYKEVFTRFKRNPTSFFLPSK